MRGGLAQRFQYDSVQVTRQLTLQLAWGSTAQTGLGLSGLPEASFCGVRRLCEKSLAGWQGLSLGNHLHPVRAVEGQFGERKLSAHQLVQHDPERSEEPPARSATR